MKTITVYEAKDGRRFDKQKDCEVYEADGCVAFKPVPKYGHHVPLTREDIAWMSNGDGDCYYATATRYDPQSSPNLNVKPPEWATHLLYFGK